MGHGFHSYVSRIPTPRASLDFLGQAAFSCGMTCTASARSSTSWRHKAVPVAKCGAQWKTLFFSGFLGHKLLYQPSFVRQLGETVIAVIFLIDSHGIPLNSDCIPSFGCSNPNAMKSFWLDKPVNIHLFISAPLLMYDCYAYKWAWRHTKYVCIHMYIYIHTY